MYTWPYQRSQAELAVEPVTPYSAEAEEQPKALRQPWKKMDLSQAQELPYGKGTWMEWNMSDNKEVSANIGGSCLTAQVKLNIRV